MFLKREPLISVCVPVYDTEPFLEQALRSAAAQDFDNFEIVVVSDASRGKDARGRNAKKIVKAVQKECDSLRKEKRLPLVPFKFIEHSENRGLVEARRTLVREAGGKWIAMLDSDDVMDPCALSAMHVAALESGADIVHGASTAGVFNKDGEFTPAGQNVYGNITYGILEGHDIFSSWIMEWKLTSNTWGKLILRDLFVRAYENIPYIECNFAEDVLLFFFISLNAVRYIGIQDKVYRYRLNVGMTSARKIDTMRKWRMICSAASVFTVISQWIADSRESPLEADELEKIRSMTRGYLANNLRQYYETVVPELQEEAYAMLCEYWGEVFVKKVDAAIGRAN